MNNPKNLLYVNRVRRAADFIALTGSIAYVGLAFTTFATVSANPVALTTLVMFAAFALCCGYLGWRAARAHAHARHAREVRDIEDSTRQLDDAQWTQEQMDDAFKDYATTGRGVMPPFNRITLPTDEQLRADIVGKPKFTLPEPAEWEVKAQETYRRIIADTLAKAEKVMSTPDYLVLATLMEPLVTGDMLHRKTSQCDLPPPGWYCTRGKGHEGPCAAHPGGWGDGRTNTWDVSTVQARRAAEAALDRTGAVAIKRSYDGDNKLVSEEVLPDHLPYGERRESIDDRGVLGDDERVGAPTEKGLETLDRYEHGAYVRSPHIGKGAQALKDFGRENRARYWMGRAEQITENDPAGKAELAEILESGIHAGLSRAEVREAAEAVKNAHQLALTHSGDNEMALITTRASEEKATRLAVVLATQMESLMDQRDDLLGRVIGGMGMVQAASRAAATGQYDTFSGSGEHIPGVGEEGFVPPPGFGMDGQPLTGDEPPIAPGTHWERRPDGTETLRNDDEPSQAEIDRAAGIKPRVVAPPYDSIDLSGDIPKD